MSFLIWLVSLKVFFLGRQITNIVELAYEMMHTICMSIRKQGRISLKLDTSKAYSRVKWSFVVKVMEKMGFLDHWVCLIWNCMSFITYSVKVNNSILDNIVPSLGLRQGDPYHHTFSYCVEKTYPPFWKKQNPLNLFTGFK